MHHHKSENGLFNDLWPGMSSQQSPRLKSELADFTIPQDSASVGLKKVLRTAQSPGREAIQSTADAHAQS